MCLPSTKAYWPLALEVVVVAKVPVGWSALRIYKQLSTQKHLDWIMVSRAIHLFCRSKHSGSSMGSASSCSASWISSNSSWFWKRLSLELGKQQKTRATFLISFVPEEVLLFGLCYKKWPVFTQNIIKRLHRKCCFWMLRKFHWIIFGYALHILSIPNWNVTSSCVSTGAERLNSLAPLQLWHR